MEIVLQTFHRTSSNRPYRSISGLSICNKEICISFYVVLFQTIMSVRFVYFRGRSCIQCHVNLCNVYRQIFESDSSSLVPVQTRRKKVHTSVGWDMDRGSLISMLHLVGVGDSELFYPGSWCYFDFVRDTTGNRVMSYIYSVFGFFIVLVTILANILTMCRMCWDPITGGILLDSRQVPGFIDVHVMIFIITVTIVFFILWTPLLVS